MFERYTDRARLTIVLALEESRRLNHDYIGTEHILLGLLAEGEGIAGRALISFGIDLEVARVKVEELVPKGGSSPSGHIPFTPRCKKALDLSLRESFQLGHRYISTEHLLLGLLREGEGFGCQAIVALGASLDDVRSRTLELIAATDMDSDEGESQVELARSALGTLRQNPQDGGILDGPTAPDGEPLVTIQLREGDLATTFELLRCLDAVIGCDTADERIPHLKELYKQMARADQSRRRDERGEDAGNYFYRMLQILNI